MKRDRAPDVDDDIFLVYTNGRILETAPSYCFSAARCAMSSTG